MTFAQVVKFFGSVERAARTLGYTRQGVYWWREHGIPPKTQSLIEYKTGGALRAGK